MPINITKPKPPKKSLANSMHRIFNSSPIDFKGVGIDMIEQVSYNKYKVHPTNKKQFLNSIREANPTLNFGGILNDPDYVNETSELINKPDEEIWNVSCAENGCFIIQK